MDKKIRSLIVVLLFLLFYASAMGQQRFRYWSDGPLTWKDFTESDSLGHKPNLSVSWIRKKAKVKEGRRTYEYFNFRTVGNKEGSTVGNDCMTDDYLALMQSLFNKAEMLGREMRDSMLFSSQDIKYHIGQASKSFNQYKEETLMSGLTDANGPGEDNFRISSLPFRTASRGFGLFLSSGLNVPFGDMAGLTGPLLVLSPETELVFGKMAVSGRASLGVGKSKEKYLGVIGLGDKHNIVLFSGLNIGPAYRILSGDGLALTVFAHGGYSSYSLSDIKIKGLSFDEGVRMDFITSERVVFGQRHSVFKYGIHMNIYGGQIWKPSANVVIPTLNMSVGITLYGNGISRM